MTHYIVAPDVQGQELAQFKLETTDAIVCLLSEIHQLETRRKELTEEGLLARLKLRALRAFKENGQLDIRDDTKIQASVSTKLMDVCDGYKFLYKKEVVLLANNLNLRQQACQCDIKTI